MVVILVLGRLREENPWGLLVSLFSRFQVSERPCLTNTGWNIKAILSPTMCVHFHKHTHCITYAHILHMNLYTHVVHI